VRREPNARLWTKIAHIWPAGFETYFKRFGVVACFVIGAWKIKMSSTRPQNVGIKAFEIYVPSRVSRRRHLFLRVFSGGHWFDLVAWTPSMAKPNLVKQQGSGVESHFYE
jgi:hypothetical protein